MTDRLPKGLPQLVLTLVVGAGGGAIFTLLGLPLPWLLGALVACMIASFSGLPVEVRPGIRKVLIVMLGVMLGSTFTPDVLDRAADWTPTLLAAAGYLLLVGLLAHVFCRRVMGMDRITATFASTPGGLSEMVILGEEKGADVPSLTLVHVVRVTTILLGIPFLLTALYGGTPVAAPPPGPLWTPFEAALLPLIAIGGLGMGRLIRLPAHALTGPMLLSGAVHLGGGIEGQAPEPVSIALQLAMGSALGARFFGMKLRQMGRLLTLATLLAAGMMAVTLAAAAALSAMTGLSFQALVLALSPGGFAEMALAALSMNIDPAFVTTHHALRLALVVFIAPVVLGVWIKRVAD